MKASIEPGFYCCGSMVLNLLEKLPANTKTLSIIADYKIFSAQKK